MSDEGTRLPKLAFGYVHHPPTLCARSQAAHAKASVGVDFQAWVPCGPSLPQLVVVRLLDPAPARFDVTPLRGVRPS